MTASNEVHSDEPAFISHQRCVSSWRKSSSKRLKDCCYSLANLALIVACLAALVFVCQFWTEDTLEEYGEILLGIVFYRQLVYLVVVLSLSLAVPVMNAASACCLERRPLLLVRLVYEAAMLVLLFVGLILVAPYIRSGPLEQQLAPVLREHMKRKYNNDFSYVLLDSIQASYRCCDVDWYLANYNQEPPLSCFQSGRRYEDPCDRLIGAQVAGKCALIGAGLVLGVAALALLLAGHLFELLAGRAGCEERHYRVGARERVAGLAKGRGQGGQGAGPSEQPLMAAAPDSPPPPRPPAEDESEREPSPPEAGAWSRAGPIYRPTTQPILARAHLTSARRPQSPVPLAGSASPSPAGSRQAAGRLEGLRWWPAGRRLAPRAQPEPEREPDCAQQPEMASAAQPERSHDDSAWLEGPAPEVEQLAREWRDSQSRRSALSVRFAE